MTSDLSKTREVTADMKKHVEETIEDCSVALNNDKIKTPEGDWLFETRKVTKI